MNLFRCDMWSHRTDKMVSVPLRLCGDSSSAMLGSSCAPCMGGLAQRRACNSCSMEIHCFGCRNGRKSSRRIEETAT